MDKKCYFCIYSSVAVKKFSDAELVKLLKRAQDKNSKVGITGLLIHHNGQFMQLIEGDELVVRGLFAKLEADPRHTNVFKLLEGLTNARQFDEWSMGFKDLSVPDARQIHGFNKFLHTPLDGTEFKSSPTRAQRLLLSFKKAAGE